MTEEQRTQLLQYLMSRPFAEVEIGVMWLRNLPELSQEAEVND